MHKSSEGKVDKEGTFDAANLPFAYPLERNLEDKDTWRRNVLDSTKGLVDALLPPMAYRFWHERTVYHQGGACFTFRCSQDEKRNRTNAYNERNKGHHERNGGQRDYAKMTRFDCHSLMSVTFSAESRAVKLKFCHDKHDCYVNEQLPREIEEYINSRLFTNTPAEIVRAMRDKETPGFDDVAEHQVYYRWSTANSRV